MISMIIGFKNGKEIKVVCEEFTIEKDCFGDITSYEITGIKDNKPMYIDLKEVIYIIRDLKDEKRYV